MAAPAFGSSGALLTGSGSSASFAAPAGVAAGDAIVIVFFLDSSATVTVYPSGFAEAENSPVSLPAGGGQHSLHIVGKWASGSDAGTYDFAFSAGAYREGAAHRFTGGAGSGALFDSPTGFAVAATSGTVTPPVGTSTLGADRLLLFAGTDWSGGSWTPPAGFTERMDGGVGLVTLDELAQAVSGSSGSVSATSTGNDKRAAWIGGLRPSGTVVDTPARVPTATVDLARVSVAADTGRARAVNETGRLTTVADVGRVGTTEDLGRAVATVAL